jgi:hypothetical protein
MVVLITLSGVALAAVQLLTSYTLASTGHLQGDGVTDLTLEQGKLAIKSSVTGLVVLVVSLAFFWIYIIYVYRIVPSADAKVIAPTTSAGPIQKSPTSARASPAAPRGVELESGGLGPPPGQAPPPR